MDRSRAERVAREYQHLVGQKFDSNPASDLRIECVTIAPFDETGKYIFLRHYRDCKDIHQALSVYNSDLFDVIILTHVVYDKKEALIKDLGSYLFERNLVYDTENVIARPVKKVA